MNAAQPRSLTWTARSWPGPRARRGFALLAAPVWSAAARWPAGGSTGCVFVSGSTDSATEKVLREVKELLTGVEEKQLARLAPDVLAGVLPRIYPQMLAEIHAHQDAGRPVFIVSAAGDEIVKLIAHVLAMDGGIGTAYEVDAGGRFSGELVGTFMYGKGKLEGMRRFADEHDVDLAESWAYSDSASDLPMLRAVGNPVVVNPDAELAKLAREEGWRVMRFEKLGRQLAAGAVGTVLLFAALVSRAWTRRPPAAVGWRRDRR